MLKTFWNFIFTLNTVGIGNRFYDKLQIWPEPVLPGTLSLHIGGSLTRPGRVYSLIQDYLNQTNSCIFYSHSDYRCYMDGNIWLGFNKSNSANYRFIYRVSHETWQNARRLEYRLDFWYNLLHLFVNLILEVSF